jgi:hypothetical protein
VPARYILTRALTGMARVRTHFHQYGALLFSLLMVPESQAPIGCSRSQEARAVCPDAHIDRMPGTPLTTSQRRRPQASSARRGKRAAGHTLAISSLLLRWPIYFQDCYRRSPRRVKRAAPRSGILSNPLSFQRGGTARTATTPTPPARWAYHSVEAPSQVVREVRVPGVIPSG